VGFILGGVCRFEHLEAKSCAERELYDRAVVTLETQNSELRDLRSRLQAAEEDTHLLRSRMHSNVDLDGELRKAREEVHRLEVMLTDLAESPFMRVDGGGNLLRDAMSQKQRLEQLELSDKTFRDQVAHLQQALRGLQLELQASKRERDETREQYERLRDEQERTKVSADATLRANALLRERLALYSGGASLEGMGAIPGMHTASIHEPPIGYLHGNLCVFCVAGDALSIPPDELERALALVRRKMDRPGQYASDMASITGGPLEDLLTISGPSSLRQKVQQLQLALLESQGEVERAEKMLKAQSAISADLSAEVTDLHARLSTESTQLKKRSLDLETVAEQRLQRVHMLEAQVAQLLAQAKASAGRRTRKGRVDTTLATITDEDEVRAARKRRGSQRPAADGDASTVISDISDEDAADREPQGYNEGAAGMLDDDSLSTSVNSDVFDFAPGENRLEVYVVDAMIEPTMLARSASTFCMVDFLNFESQQTPLGFGAAPVSFLCLFARCIFRAHAFILCFFGMQVYNASSLFSFKLDAFILRYFATESVTIDVHQARGSDFDLLGRATIPLHQLLNGKTKMKLPEVAIRAKDGKVIGSLQVELRVAMGLAEAWQSFCRDHPSEAADLTATMGTSLVGTGGEGLSATNKVTANDLVVSVISASGLKSRAVIGQSGVPLNVPPSAYVQYTLPVPGVKTGMYSMHL
jgi:hypothetical protein